MYPHSPPPLVPAPTQIVEQISQLLCRISTWPEETLHTPSSQLQRPWSCINPRGHIFHQQISQASSHEDFPTCCCPCCIHIYLLQSGFQQEYDILPILYLHEHILLARLELDYTSLMFHGIQLPSKVA
ncbi:hypothetical protein V8G54_035036 [Vigna mungo]|uniref:Uncharacterized protein n=1 Tax=Vigna mungo TaxID=3915 RepID=A0AAQ3MEF8_VIGMU